MAQLREITYKSAIALLLIIKFGLFDLLSEHDRFVFKRDHVILSGLDLLLQAHNLLRHPVLLGTFKVELSAQIRQLGLLVPDLVEQLLLYLVILPFDRRRLIFGFFQVLLGHFKLLLNLLEPDLQRCVLLSCRVTLLLHPRNLRKQRLIIFLHLIDLRLVRVFLISVIISALFHLPELHLISFDFTLQLLYLPLMSIVMLQLMQLPLKPFNR